MKKMVYKITHVVICYSLQKINEETHIYHMVGYPNYPSESALISIINELAADDEFGMTNYVYGKDYIINVVERNDSKFEKMIEEFGVPLEFEVEDDA